MTPREELIWLAWLLEGEGCFDATHNGAPKRPPYPRIRIRMTDEDVVARAGKLMGKEPRRGHTPFQQARGWQPTYEVAIQGAKAVAMMEAVLPFMGHRRSEKIRALLKEYAA